MYKGPIVVLAYYIDWKFVLFIVPIRIYFFLFELPGVGALHPPKMFTTTGMVSGYTWPFFLRMGPQPCIGPWTAKGLNPGFNLNHQIKDIILYKYHFNLY